VEFKTFVSVDSDKIRELVKTVVAFLNTEGGRIYVGVNDDGRPQGRAGLKRYCSSKDPDGLPTVLASLKKVIHDNIKPVPEIGFRSQELVGEPVCIIEVPPGELVYSTQENDILIRKGSTNRKPDPASELEPLLARRRSVPQNGDVEPEGAW
jgi:ATP-dependent DNA helicase RecG